MRVRDLGILMLSAASLYGAAAAARVTSGEAVVRAMHQRYRNSWYATMKFTQKSTTYNPDGTTKVETWYEEGMLPGKLRIDIGPPSDGNGALVADGKIYSYRHGKLAATRNQLNLLLVLGFDVYRQPPEVTLAQLRQEGIDPAKFHEEVWQGEPVYVVGAAPGDLTSPQFWVEKRRLLFLRIIQPDRRNPGQLDDIHFTGYREQPRGLIAARVEVYSQGKLTFTEDYTEIQTGLKLDPSRFDPENFISPASAK